MHNYEKRHYLTFDWLNTVFSNSMEAKQIYCGSLLLKGNRKPYFFILFVVVVVCLLQQACGSKGELKQ